MLYASEGREFDMDRFDDPAFEPAHGGRSVRFDIVLEPEGRFELPNPCGARPESVAPPCALQFRVAVPDGRFVLLLLNVPVERPAFMFVAPVRLGCIADGGRLALSCDMRFVLNPGFDIECALIDVFGVCDIAFIVWKPFALAAGFVRAITLRFCTLFVGRATLL